MIPIRDDNPTGHTPYVTITLIVLNVLVFFAELSQGKNMEQFIWRYGFVPAELVESREDLHRDAIEEGVERPIVDSFGRVRVDRFGRVITQRVGLPFRDIIAVPASVNIFTCMFLHAGWMHLIGNMLYLWIFGNNIEDRLGPILFTVFYLATGVAGNLAHTAYEAGIVPLVGASGAISGVMGAYVVLHPSARVLALVPAGWYWFTVKLPAWIFLGVYFVFQNVFPVLAGAVTGHETGSVAFLAHIGGFVSGAALIFAFPRRKAAPVLRRTVIDDDDADIII